MLYSIGKIMILLLVTSCSGTKYLKEGETFYSGAEIKINTFEKVGGKKRLVKNLEQYLLPKPNVAILGSRPGVWFY